MYFGYVMSHVKNDTFCTSPFSFVLPPLDHIFFGEFVLYYLKNLYYDGVPQYGIIVKHNDENRDTLHIFSAFLAYCETFVWVFWGKR